MDNVKEHWKLLNEIDAHLLDDLKPSQYFQSLSSPLFSFERPFTMLSRLKGIKQSPIHHPEGSVWNHTMLAIDEASKRKDQASDARVFMWATLLHDIGKAVTTKRRKGKITAYNHDLAGAEMAREFLMGFEQDPFISKVAALVRWHMQILYLAKSRRHADLETMRLEADINDIALLGLCDRLGRKNVNQHAEEQSIAEFIKKAGEMG